MNLCLPLHARNLPFAFCILVFLVCSESSNAQEFWAPLCPSYIPTSPAPLRLRDGRILCQINDSVLASRDDGATWQRIAYLSYANTIMAIDSSGAWWAANFNTQTPPSISRDEGKTWTATAFPFPGMPMGIQCSLNDVFVRVHPNNAFGDVIIVHSSDGGKNWNNTGLTQSLSHTAGIIVAHDGTGYGYENLNYVSVSTDRGQSFHPTRLYLVAVDGSTIATIDSAGVSISKDDGHTWTRNSASLPAAADVLNISFCGADGIYANALDGIYQIASPDQDRNDVWHKQSGITSTSTFFFGNSRTIGLSSKGIAYSDPDHTLHSSLELLGPPRTVAQLVQDDMGNLFATQDSILYRSSDYGNSWRYIHSQVLRCGPDHGGILCWIRVGNRVALIHQDRLSSVWDTIPQVDSIDPRMCFELGGDLYADSLTFLLRSTDRGVHWQPLCRDAHYGLHGLTRTKAGSLLASFGSGVKRSVDNGATWTDIPISNASELELVSGDGGVVFVTDGTRLFRSTDDVLQWTKLEIYWNVNLHLAAGPEGKTVVSYVRSATINGVDKQVSRLLVTPDHGVSWLDLSTTDTIDVINGMLVGKDGNLIAATDKYIRHSALPTFAKQPEAARPSTKPENEIQLSAIDANHIKAIVSKPIDALLTFTNTAGQNISESSIHFAQGTTIVTVPLAARLAHFCKASFGESAVSCKY